MIRSKDEQRFRLVVAILVILGLLILALVTLLMLFGQAGQLVHVILAVTVFISVTLAVALGYNIFAKYRDGSGRDAEIKATPPAE